MATIVEGGPTNRRLLIIDDDEAIHADLRRVLDPDDTKRYELNSASVGQVGLEMLARAEAEERPYAVVWLEVRMPAGVETLERIRQTFPHVEVVLFGGLSGSSWADLTRRIVPTDQLMIVPKPLDVVAVEQAASVMTKKWALADTLRRHVDRTRDADAAALAKASFLRASTHEVRTPLNGIVGMLAILSDTTLSEDQRSHLDDARQASDALLELIEGVLEFSKAQNGEVRLQHVEFDPRNVVATSIEFARRSAEAKGLALTIDIDASMPRVVVGDATQIDRVLAQLLSNAIKFTAEGRVVLRARSREAQRPWLRFEIEDTGIGLPENDRAAIFEAFRQADGSITRVHGGLGLGLALARHLVRLMGGRLGVESKLHEGSLFWIEVPVDEATVEPNAHDTQDFVGRRALVVEDNVVNQRVAVRFLEKLGFATEVAVDGVEAVEKVNRASFDLVLMDVQMPRMDGREATRNIRSNGLGLPIVALTAHDLPDDRELCLDAGMDAYLTKPLRRESLRSTLHRVFSNQSP